MRLAIESTNSIIQQTSDKEIDLLLQNSPRPPSWTRPQKQEGIQSLEANPATNRQREPKDQQTRGEMVRPTGGTPTGRLLENTISYDTETSF